MGALYSRKLRMTIVTFVAILPVQERCAVGYVDLSLIHETYNLKRKSLIKDTFQL